MTQPADSSQTDNPSNPADGDSTDGPPVRVLSGRAVVAGIFVFATLLTGTMWVYWKLQDGPFIPLEAALSREFKGSRPRVEGGRHKTNQNSPTILRITMKVDFDPTQKTERFQAFADQVSEFTSQHFNIRPYQILEIYLFQPQPEHELRQKRIRIPIASLLNSDHG